MEYGACEIVRVLGSRILTDAQLRDPGRRSAEAAMYPGYYVVFWPARLSRKPARTPTRLGPFHSNAEAQMLATSARALGLVSLPMRDNALSGPSAVPPLFRVAQPSMEEAAAVF